MSKKAGATGHTRRQQHQQELPWLPTTAVVDNTTTETPTEGTNATTPPPEQQRDFHAGGTQLEHQLSYMSEQHHAWWRQ